MAPPLFVIVRHSYTDRSDDFPSYWNNVVGKWTDDVDDATHFTDRPRAMIAFVRNQLAVAYPDDVIDVESLVEFCLPD